MSISYRTFSNMPTMKTCGMSDATFMAKMVTTGLDQYQGFMVEGTRGTCQRANAAQLKRLYPDKVVLNYAFELTFDPSQTPGMWPGYFTLMNRTTLTATPSATATTLTVLDSSVVHAGDGALLFAPSSGDLFGQYEYLTITGVVDARTVTVRRKSYGLGTPFTTAPYLAALYTSDKTLEPILNHSSVAPVNPATGQRAIDWLLARFANDFVPAPGAPPLDGYEFDSTLPKPLPYNQNGTLQNLDCNADGVIDYCTTAIGTPLQMSSWALGYQEFLDNLRTALSAYDTPGTTTPKLVISDQRQNTNKPGRGVEMESYPWWDNYQDGSIGYSNLGLFAHQFPNGLSYAFTKDISPIYPSISPQNPTGCIPPPLGNCRNGNFRFGMASAALQDAASAYNDESWFDHPVPLDEQATVNTATTGLRPGYLGSPLGPPVRQSRYTGPRLVTNPDVETSLTGWTLGEKAPANATFTQDLTTAGNGKASMKVDVTTLPASPTIGDIRLRYVLGGPVAADQEYTVSFWAKASDARGNQIHTVRILLDGSSNGTMDVIFSPQWRRYFLNVPTFATGSTAPALTFQLAGEIGTYWLDNVQVRQGTAGIITREFTNGIVVLSDSAFRQANIPLPGGPYHHFRGVQDPVVNNGSSVGSLLPSISDKDGVFLLRG